MVDIVQEIEAIFNNSHFEDVILQEAFKTNVHKSRRRNEKNPLDENGQCTRCTICESIFYWATANPCPPRETGACEIHYHSTLFQSNLTDQDCMKIFVSESLSATVLDSAETSLEVMDGLLH